MTRRHGVDRAVQLLSLLLLNAALAATAPAQTGRGAVIATPMRPGDPRGLEAARAAMEQVRSIRLTPDTIRLEVGGRVAMGSYHAEGLDADGKPVPGFVPLFSVANGDIARIEGIGGLMGMSAGRTWLRVSATIPGALPSPGEVRVMSQIPIIVDEASSPIPRPETSMVPQDLVLALLGQGQRNPVLRVGAVANGFPEWLATDWRVLGSSQMYANQTTTVFVAPYMSRVVLDTIEARVQAAGWMPAPGEAPARGFVAAFATTGRSNVRCQGTDHLWWNASSRLPNETQVVVILTRRSTTGVCSPSATSRPQPPAAMPGLQLRAPAEVILQQARNEGTPVEWVSEAVAQGQTSVTRLGRHYADQAVAAGWAPADSVITPTLETRTWRRTAANIAWQAQLTVAALADGAPASLRLTIAPAR